MKTMRSCPIAAEVALTPLMQAAEQRCVGMPAPRITPSLGASGLGALITVTADNTDTHAYAP